MIIKLKFMETEAKFHIIRTQYFAGRMFVT